MCTVRYPTEESRCLDTCIVRDLISSVIPKVTPKECDYPFQVAEYDSAVMY